MTNYLKVKQHRVYTTISYVSETQKRLLLVFVLALMLLIVSVMVAYKTRLEDSSALNKMDFGASNEHSLSFTTRNVRVLITLLEAVQQMDRANLRIGYDKSGLHLNEFTNEQSIVLFATLHAQVFEDFVTTGKGVVGVYPKETIQVLKYCAVEDKIKFTYDHKKPKTCKLEIIKEKKSGTNNDEYVFEIKTYCLEEEERALYVSQQEAYDAEAKISARDVQNFISALLALEHQYCLDKSYYRGDAHVELSVSESMILMEKNGDTCHRSRLIMLTDKGKQARESSKKKLDPFRRTVLESVKKKFLLRHLQLVSKFFLINPNKDASLTVYVKKDPPTFPVIFGINVGDLGQAHVALCPYEPNEI